MIRPRRRTVALALSGAVAAITLSACAQSNGLALARQACDHVDHSLSLFRQANASSSPSQASALRERAYVQLRFALPIAAQAAADDGHWQALMTTISESNRVPEHYLVTALKDQCADAKSGNPNGPAPSLTVPPPSSTPASTQTSGNASS